ncbi:MAG: putative manganese-dependent inorganic diphosphatase [Syntrophomonas sp.]|nr:putative manganese-dependent inorganic diphosphatase [Syntrophomonas sp.]
MKPIYVIGHKHPDIDSIAASIAYKVFKQSTEKELYLVAAAGELNSELKWLLDYLGLEHPRVLNDVGTKVGDLLDDELPLYISADTTMAELGNIMRKNGLKTVPVLDEKQRFLGLITIGDVAMIYMDALGSGRDIERSPEILKNLLEQKAGDIMKTRDLILFEPDEKVEEARKNMLASRFRNYPVVDDENRYLGMISRYNLLQMKRKQVILVDHNEKKQAVDGIEEADILEIIDHHRVGDLQTLYPIYFHNEPVGSTSTLIAEKFLLNQVYLSTNIASLLLSGIMSDTMIFKSPTTTAKDKRIVQELERISGLEAFTWGKKLYSETNRVDKQTDEALISEDLKEYVSGDTTFAISQVETVDLSIFAERRVLLLQTMEAMCERKGYALLCLMVTNIFEDGTEMIVAGRKKALVEKAFKHEHLHGGIFLHGVLSRKKQVVPVIYQMLRQENMM